jgi:hypothetical protein
MVFDKYITTLNPSIIVLISSIQIVGSKELHISIVKI